MAKKPTIAWMVFTLSWMRCILSSFLMTLQFRHVISDIIRSTFAACLSLYPSIASCYFRTWQAMKKKSIVIHTVRFSPKNVGKKTCKPTCHRNARPIRNAFIRSKSNALRVPQRAHARTAAPKAKENRLFSYGSGHAQHTQPLSVVSIVSRLWYSDNRAHRLYDGQAK